MASSETSLTCVAVAMKLLHPARAVTGAPTEVFALRGAGLVPLFWMTVAPAPHKSIRRM